MPTFNAIDVESVNANRASIPSARDERGQFYRWRNEYAGMSSDQRRRLKELEKENVRLRRTVSDLTLDKQIVKEAGRGNFQSPRVAASASIVSVTGSGSRSVGHAGCWDSTARPSAASHAAVPTRSAWSLT